MPALLMLAVVVLMARSTAVPTSNNNNNENGTGKRSRRSSFSAATMSSSNAASVLVLLGALHKLHPASHPDPICHHFKVDLRRRNASSSPPPTKKMELEMNVLRASFKPSTKPVCFDLQPRQWLCTSQSLDERNVPPPAKDASSNRSPSSALLSVQLPNRLPTSTSFSSKKHSNVYSLITIGCLAHKVSLPAYGEGQVRSIRETKSLRSW